MRTRTLDACMPLTESFSAILRLEHVCLYLPRSNPRAAPARSAPFTPQAQGLVVTNSSADPSAATMAAIQQAEPSFQVG